MAIALSDAYCHFNLWESSINGLRLHHLYLPEANFVHVGFVVHCGSRQDPADWQGIAHFVEHLTSKSGSVGKVAIESFFREHGGSFNFGITFPEATTYGFSLPAKPVVLKKGLALFSSMLLPPKLKGYKQERAIVANEADRRRGDRIAWEKKTRESAKVFHWHPFFKNPFRTFGRQEIIYSLSEDEVQSFHDRYYIPANIEMVVAGGLEEESLIVSLSETELYLEKKGERTRPAAKLEPELPLEKEYFSPGITENKDEVIDCYCSAALPPVFHNQTVRVFSKMLDKVLDKRMREGGLGLYRASSGWRNYGDFINVWLDIDAIRARGAKKVSALIDDCLLEVAANKRLFKQVKKWNLATFGINDERGRDLVSSVAENLRSGRRIITLSESYRCLEVVNFSEISSLAEDMQRQIWKAFLRTS